MYTYVSAHFTYKLYWCGLGGCGAVALQEEPSSSKHYLLYYRNYMPERSQVQLHIKSNITLRGMVIIFNQLSTNVLAQHLMSPRETPKYTTQMVATWSPYVTLMEVAYLSVSIHGPLKWRYSLQIRVCRADILVLSSVENYNSWSFTPYVDVP